MKLASRLLTSLLGLAVLASPLQATWSIVCVNLKTREVGVATATCLENFNLKSGVPVIFVGEGAAAAQSLLDTFGMNRRLIYFSFRDTEETPAEILARLADTDFGHQTRQYGIVNFTGPPVTFTGTGAGAAALGVTGQVGDWVYAIQGNILTGDEVILAAEHAFKFAKGDMGQKLMAAMHAARDLGGDGRCSCSQNQPTSCGVPPNDGDFEKSSHVGTVVVARMGDANGGCNANRGCAKGDYYMTLNVVGDASDPDPVFTLQERYDNWRRKHVNAPDGHLSSVRGVKRMPIDGLTQTTLTVVLRDIEGRQLLDDLARVEVVPFEGETPRTTIGPVNNLGNGLYSFTVTAGTEIGVDRFMVKAGLGTVEATLFPFLEIESVPATGLFLMNERVSSHEGGTLPFVLHAPERPGAPYWIFGSLQPSGTRLFAPGLVTPAVPLNVGIEPFFPAAPLTLDANGRDEVALHAPPAALDGLVGARIEWTGVVLGGPEPSATDVAVVDVRP